MKPERRTLAAGTKGWLFDDEAEALHRYASEDFTGDLVEVGSYCGKSTLWIGDAAEKRGRTLWAVDWHRGSPEMQPGRENHDAEMMRDGNLFDTLPVWRRNMAEADLDDSVIGVIGKSVQVADRWTTPVGFLFIDADHGKAVVDDYRHWRPHLTDDSWLLFHDATIHTVGHAVNIALSDGYERVARIETLEVLRCVR